MRLPIVGVDDRNSGEFRYVSESFIEFDNTLKTDQVFIAPRLIEMSISNCR